MLLAAPFLPFPPEPESPCLQALKNLETSLHQLPRPVAHLPAPLLRVVESIYIKKIQELVTRWRDTESCDSRAQAELQEAIVLHGRKMELATRVHAQYQTEKTALCREEIDLGNLGPLLSTHPATGAKLGIDSLRQHLEQHKELLGIRWQRLLEDPEFAASPADCAAPPRMPGAGPRPPPAGRTRKGALAITPMLTQSSALAPGAPALTLVARRRGLELGKETMRTPSDIIDARIRSPKSVRFSPDSQELYVEALEGSRTLILSQDGLDDRDSILHAFNRLTEPLFPPLAPGQKRNFNHFLGKPVETELTHGGKFLWVPYYRRSFDTHSREASAMALIDTSARKIIRVLPTGPISKGVRASRDGHWLAVSHWGDNTVGLWDISGDDPERFHLAARFAAGSPLNLKKISGDRDVNCGLCVRGLEFSEDALRLWVTAMRGGFVAEFDLRQLPALPLFGSPRILYRGLGQAPRDIELTADGKSLLTSCAKTGTISKIELEKEMPFPDDGDRAPAFLPSKPPTVSVHADSVRLSGGVRSIRISPDDRHVYAAINGTSRIGVISLDGKLEIAASIATDPYPVGLDISPDGHWLAVTAQGKKGMGGDSLSIYRIQVPDADGRLAREPPADLIELLN